MNQLVVSLQSVDKRQESFCCTWTMTHSKIHTVVFHRLSIRWGCFGCVMKTNGDVAALQRLGTQPHPSPSEWDLFAITVRGCRAPKAHITAVTPLDWAQAPKCVQLIGNFALKPGLMVAPEDSHQLTGLICKYRLSARWWPPRFDKTSRHQGKIWVKSKCFKR